MVKIALKIQISKFYKLSIILFILSGCQELQELNIYNNDNIPIISSYSNDKSNKEAKIKNFDNNSMFSEKKDNDLNKKFDKSSEISERKIIDIKNIYQFIYHDLTKLKASLGILGTLNVEHSIERKFIKQSNYSKPYINMNFNISNIIQKLVLKKKSLHYKNTLIQKKISNAYNFFKLDDLNLIRKSELFNLLNKPDYKRKQSNIFTLQYRLDNCVIDFFFKENNEEMIYYDIRSRKYNGVLSRNNCELELNLRKIYN